MYSCLDTPRSRLSCMKTKSKSMEKKTSSLTLQEILMNQTWHFFGIEEAIWRSGLESTYSFKRRSPTDPLRHTELPDLLTGGRRSLPYIKNLTLGQLWTFALTPPSPRWPPHKNCHRSSLKWLLLVKIRTSKNRSYILRPFDPSFSAVHVRHVIKGVRSNAPPVNCPPVRCPLFFATPVKRPLDKTPPVNRPSGQTTLPVTL